VSLVRKGVSLATAEASRANGRKANKPAADEGKLMLRQDPLKHWGRTESIRPLFSPLGEDPAEFESLRDGLYDALDPRDAFEALLVDDMADIHWRLRRLIRAEAAAQATRRREQQALREEEDAGREAGRLNELEPYTISTLGLAGLRDSPPKFARILQILGAVRMIVDGEGFAEEYVVYLQTVYGSNNPGLRGRHLMGEYRRFCKEQASTDAATREANRTAFLHELEAEIAWFNERSARDRQARAELKIPRLEAELLKADYNQATFMLYQETLERRFERKWKLLRRHRTARRAEERKAMFAEAKADGPTALAEGREALSLPAPGSITQEANESEAGAGREREHLNDRSKS
jgi:hypothetical protein